MLNKTWTVYSLINNVTGERTHTHGYMFISVDVNEVINNE